MTERKFRILMALIALTGLAILGALLVFMVIPHERASWECAKRCAPLDSRTSAPILGNECVCVECTAAALSAGEGDL